MEWLRISVKSAKMSFPAKEWNPCLPWLLKSAGLQAADNAFVMASAGGHWYKDKAEGTGIVKALGAIPVAVLTPYLGDANSSLGLISIGIGLNSFTAGKIPVHYEKREGIGEYPCFARCMYTSITSPEKKTLKNVISGIDGKIILLI